jgi:hypothetical protein
MLQARAFELRAFLEALPAMNDANDIYPRRYHLNALGRHVLIGLTVEETCEFETLDAPPPLDESESFEESAPTRREQRWLELYTKHDTAWKTWSLESSSHPFSPVTGRRPPSPELASKS